MTVTRNRTAILAAYLSLNESRMDMDEFSKVLASDLMRDALRLFALTHNGDLSLMKNRALYADVGDDGIAHDPVCEIGAEKAKDVIGMCRHALTFFREHVLSPPAEMPIAS
jgi:hypothetical protein